MSGQESTQLQFRSPRTIHDEGERDEGVWQEFSGEGQDVDCDVGVWIVLREGVCVGENEGLKEEGSTKTETASSLFTKAHH
jgi:hypothetical protein